jgi:hypothetical protein
LHPRPETGLKRSKEVIGLVVGTAEPAQLRETANVIEVHAVKMLPEDPQPILKAKYFNAWKAARITKLAIEIVQIKRQRPDAFGC